MDLSDRVTCDLKAGAACEGVLSQPDVLLWRPRQAIEQIVDAPSARRSQDAPCKNRKYRRLHVVAKNPAAALASSLLKNLEMESFRILAGRCWSGAVELDVIFSLLLGAC
jgi:hypothetical protein